MDDEGGNHLPVPPAAAGSLPGLRIRTGSGVARGTLSNPERRWFWRPVGDPPPHSITTDILGFFSKNVEAAGFPSRVVSGESSNEDGTRRALPAPAQAGHRDHFGGEKPPPPTVYPL